MIETLSMSPSGGVTDGDLANLTPDPQNARLHSSENLDMIQASLEELGAGRSILIDENDVILAGNGVAEAAQKAGMTRVQIVEADGDAIIAVRRRNLTPDQKTRLALFDNRASDLSTFDPLMLAGLQAEGVSLDGLWTGDELDALLADLPSMEALSAEPDTVTITDYGGSERGAARDREYEEVRLPLVGTERGERRENTQEREVSPRPPSADWDKSERYTEPYQAPKEHPASEERPDTPAPAPVPGLDRVAPTAGLDRVTPGQETSRAGLFLHFRGLKIPLSAEEGAALDARLAQHRDAVGTYYGFIDSLLAPVDALLASAQAEGKGEPA